MQEDVSLERYRILAAKWLDKSITPDEEVEFSAWYNHGQDKPVVVPPDFAESEEVHRLRLLNKITTAVEQTPKKKTLKFPFLGLTAAAAVLFFVAIGLYLYWPNHAGQETNKVLNLNDFGPGSTKAVLILSNGKKIDLAHGENGVIAHQGNTAIRKTAEGQLVYHADNSKTEGAPAYNLIQIPRGGEYQLVLPDGTKVWLNASSSLRYPARFFGKERLVELQGEAYFEVTKNPELPFKVAVKGMEVDVLGTHFNIEAYPEEETAKTTLLEGSVKVYNGQPMHGRELDSKILKPGEQAILKGGAIRVQSADTEGAVAWKNGLTYFDKSDIKSIMRQVSRWYNIEVEFSGDLSGRTFTGKIPRSANLSKVLKVLELSDIHFKVTADKILVTP